MASAAEAPKTEESGVMSERVLGPEERICEGDFVKKIPREGAVRHEPINSRLFGLLVRDVEGPPIFREILCRKCRDLGRPTCVCGQWSEADQKDLENLAAGSEEIREFSKNRRLTPAAALDRENFERTYGKDGDCSCHIAAPCGSCTDSGNPQNQDEDETAWEPEPVAPSQPAGRRLALNEKVEAGDMLRIEGAPAEPVPETWIGHIVSEFEDADPEIFRKVEPEVPAENECRQLGSERLQPGDLVKSPHAPFALSPIPPSWIGLDASTLEMKCFRVFRKREPGELRTRRFPEDTLCPICGEPACWKGEPVKTSCFCEKCGVVFDPIELWEIQEGSKAPVASRQLHEDELIQAGDEWVCVAAEGKSIPQLVAPEMVGEPAKAFAPVFRKIPAGTKPQVTVHVIMPPAPPVEEPKPLASGAIHAICVHCHKPISLFHAPGEVGHGEWKHVDDLMSCWNGTEMRGTFATPPAGSKPPAWFGTALVEAQAADAFNAGKIIAKCKTCSGLLIHNDENASWDHTSAADHFPVPIEILNPLEVNDDAPPKASEFTKCPHCEGMVQPTGAGFCPMCEKPMEELGPETPPGEIHNSAMTYTPTWRDRIAWFFFPSKVADFPEPEWTTRDGVHTGVGVKLSWVDLLRLIVSRRCLITVTTACENVVGKTLTNSEFQVLPPQFLQNEK